ncbi:hypothetical protein CERSUDRAFT_93487 [Gelatoporia subvermispora B]|uniref:Uncharacterized protein n=1 Tax=Ceriporiopsis subvermispora (strain B) TaxID=914234 RepID=M2RHK1_CERS8|nr:hypothetical protein CERSUDRAFT_93487 [Gelatoporia subvermispora B]
MPVLPDFLFWLFLDHLINVLRLRNVVTVIQSFLTTLSSRFFDHVIFASAVVLLVLAVYVSNLVVHVAQVILAHPNLQITHRAQRALRVTKGLVYFSFALAFKFALLLINCAYYLAFRTAVTTTLALFWVSELGFRLTIGLPGSVKTMPSFRRFVFVFPSEGVFCAGGDACAASHVQCSCCGLSINASSPCRSSLCAEGKRSLQDARRGKKMYKRKFNAADKKVFVLRFKATSLEVKVAEMHKQIETLRTDKAALASSDASQRSRITALTGQVTQSQSTIDGIHAANATLRTENTGLLSEISGLHARIADLESQCTTLTNNEDDLRSHITTLQLGVSRFSALEFEVLELSAANEGLRTQLGYTVTSRDMSVDEALTLRSERDELKSALSTMQYEHATLQSRLGDTDAKCNALCKQRLDIVSHAGRSQNELQEARRKIAAERASAKHAMSRQAAAEAEVRRLSSELAATKADLNRTKDMYTDREHSMKSKKKQTKTVGITTTSPKTVQRKQQLPAVHQPSASGNKKRDENSNFRGRAQTNPSILALSCSSELADASMEVHMHTIDLEVSREHDIALLPSLKPNMEHLRKGLKPLLHRQLETREVKAASRSSDLEETSMEVHRHTLDLDTSEEEKHDGKVDLNQILEGFAASRKLELERREMGFVGAEALFTRPDKIAEVDVERDRTLAATNTRLVVSTSEDNLCSSDIDETSMEVNQHTLDLDTSEEEQHDGKIDLEQILKGLAATRKQVLERRETAFGGSIGLFMRRPDAAEVNVCAPKPQETEKVEKDTRPSLMDTSFEIPSLPSVELTKPSTSFELELAHANLITSGSDIDDDFAPLAHSIEYSQLSSRPPSLVRDTTPDTDSRESSPDIATPQAQTCGLFGASPSNAQEKLRTSSIRRSRLAVGKSSLHKRTNTSRSGDTGTSRTTVLSLHV